MRIQTCLYHFIVHAANVRYWCSHCKGRLNHSGQWLNRIAAMWPTSGSETTGDSAVSVGPAEAGPVIILHRGAVGVKPSRVRHPIE